MTSKQALQAELVEEKRKLARYETAGNMFAPVLISQSKLAIGIIERQLARLSK